MHNYFLICEYVSILLKTLNLYVWICAHVSSLYSVDWPTFPGLFMFVFGLLFRTLGLCLFGCNEWEVCVLRHLCYKRSKTFNKKERQISVPTTHIPSSSFSLSWSSVFSFSSSCIFNCNKKSPDWLAEYLNTLLMRLVLWMIKVLTHCIHKFYNRENDLQTMITIWYLFALHHIISLSNESFPLFEPLLL